MPTTDHITRRDALRAGLGLLVLAPLAGLRAQTPAQVEGPFFPARNQADKDSDMTRIDGHPGRARGEVVELRGRVLDDAGLPVAGAIVDIWQANASGRYAHEGDTNPAPLDPDFQGWARLVTDADGGYAVRTIIPGAYPVEAGWTRPPHIHFKVARRGFHELVTQMYFAGNPLNDVDRLLQAVPEADRAQLVVAFDGDGGRGAGVRGGVFDLVLRRA